MENESSDYRDPSSAMDQRIRELTAQGFRMNISEYLKIAWELFKKDLGSFVLFALIFVLINGTLGLLSSQIIYGGSLIQMIITPPLYMGLVNVAYKLDRGEPYEFSAFFDGFKRFKPLALAGLVTGLLTSLGFLLCIIPGIYLAVAYSFTYLIIWFGKREDFWESMEASRKMITEEWFNFFFLVLVLLIINILGALALGVGLLISLPVSALTI